jgi:hypothetical protein
MATLIVKLEGLICHVGPDADHKTHAVLVHEPGMHKPCLRVGQFTFDLRQWDTVTFEGPIVGPARTIDTFRRLVPGLQNEIRNGALHAKILDQIHSHAGVVAYVIYPGGTLAAPQAHPYKLKLTLGTSTPVAQCIAQGVRFESDPFDRDQFTIVVTHHDDQGTPTATDRFTFDLPNEVSVDNVSGTGNHFHEYIHLTDANLISKAESGDPCSNTVSTVSTDQPMFMSKISAERNFLQQRNEQWDASARSPESTFVFTASINPECTNSQWP